MDVLFLDANVLFSAAYLPGAGVRLLWDLTGVELISSDYAIEEARRNLPPGAARDRLADLLGRIRRVTSLPDRPMPRGVTLPEKDRPILLAALHARATHLLTGDITHFGPYLGKRVEGLRICTPAAYLGEG